jgi:hypothetical protein
LTLLASLTKKDRDALSTDDFAFPRTRQCPMHDAKHVKMAWDMITTTKGVTEEERAEARRRVLAKAKTLGVDTSSWNKIKAMRWTIESLEAMSLDIPSSPDHPNRVPFSGVLTRVDVASDGPPHGSNGKLVMLPAAVAQRALPSLLGMAVNYASNLAGHNPQAKIGIITDATIEGTNLMIGGFFYGSDFSKAVSRIQADKEDLGFSFEAEQIHVRSMEEDPLVITDLYFTGAAILYKDDAAFTTTSLAAAREATAEEEKKLDKEQFDALMASIGAVKTDVTATNERLAKLEANGMAAGSVAPKVQPHADALKACAAAMERDGIGMHASRGHVAVLRHMADSMMAEAHQGKIPSEYSGPSMYHSTAQVPAAATPVADPAIKAEVEAIKASVQKTTDALASMTTMLTDIQAAARRTSTAPERKTIDARMERLLAKSGHPELANGEKMTIMALDAALKGGSLTPEERMEVKMKLRNAGLLVDQAA